MSEIMRPMPFSKLMRWALEEYRKEGRVFGISKEKFYRNQRGSSLSIFDGELHAPLGPAAGPHSQLAQNIIASFVAGGRFMELKTVQKMDGDELRTCVPRPCILAEDEGYNVEWSTELTVEQALEEYVKAWMAVHVLCRELDISQTPGCVFNMSVGYDLEGIQGAKIDAYVEGMKDASHTNIWQEGMAWLRSNRGLLSHTTEEDIANIPPQVSRSVTLSTLHGCPPQEIERIAKYLLTEKQVHTFVKCNPTLLGYQAARELLDGMGFGYVSFDEHHFQNDLQFPDAVDMLGRLLSHAEQCGLRFGVKITNTFPVQICRGELPGEEMYMSGRALFPLSIQVASRLTTVFEGRLPISYSGGADAFNVEEIFRLGIRPITVATTLLKPGGYERLNQLATKLEPMLASATERVDGPGLAAYVQTLSSLPLYRKESRPVASRKTDSPLPMFDCFMAPCKEAGCPIHQQIPEYLRLVAEGRYEDAFRVISIDNAAPSITGTLCNHACQGKCTRMDYETPLEIRQMKLLAAQAAQESHVADITPPPLRTKYRVAVVGAGPAGVAAALYLRRNGVAATVYEKRQKPFGIVQYVIPAFRIEGEALERDFRMAEKMGVEFRFGQEAPPTKKLQKEYDAVILAIGAWKACAPVGEMAEPMLDALAFLEESKAKDCQVELGRSVAVIGGGDVAMDCARAAKRAPGVQRVAIVYRRTREFMPAEAEEIRLALEDGVEMQELLAPIACEAGTLRCERMALGAVDKSGRRSVTGTGQLQELPFDTVINATGARVDTSLFAAAGIAMDGRGRPQLSEALESSVPGLYIAGDCKAGPSTVVSALADAKGIAIAILQKLGLSHDFVRVEDSLPLQELYGRKGVLEAPSREATDGNRCLGCDTLCELCCDVCPNRANVRILLPGHRNHAQILHVDGLCNECGNCKGFCPHSGAPYQDKLTLFWSLEDFEDSQNRGFLLMEDGQVKIRAEDGQVRLCAPEALPGDWRAMVEAIQKYYAYLN